MVSRVPLQQSQSIRPNGYARTDSGYPHVNEEDRDWVTTRSTSSSCSQVDARPMSNSQLQNGDNSTVPSGASTYLIHDSDLYSSAGMSYASSTAYQASTKDNDEDEKAVDSWDDFAETENPIPILNSPESLRRGHLLSGTGKRDYTILLVGETGVGKTAFLSCLKNILLRKSPGNYDLNVHDFANESGLGSGFSQTNDAKLYVFTSMNGIVLRVLDTPGLADTRGIEIDEAHKEQIARSVRDAIQTSIDAVLILANGTHPRLGVPTNYALTTLSSMFPASLANNIGMFFTNVSDSLSWNFEMKSLPEPLTSVARFTFNNPVSLERKRRENPGRTQREKERLKGKVVTAHAESLEMFADLFDWLDSLTPQPTNEIVALYEYAMEIERTMLNTQSQIKQSMDAQKLLERFEKSLSKVEVDMEQYQNYQKIIHRNVYELVEFKSPATICHSEGCYCNCHLGCGMQSTGFWWWINKQRCYDCWGHTLHFWGYPPCQQCGHTREAHSHSNFRWQLKDETDVKVDEDVREKFFQAKTEKDRKEHIMRDIKQKADNISLSIKSSMETLADLAKSYSSISLSGNYSSHLEEGIKLSKQVLKTMRANGNDTAVIDNLDANIEVLEEKLRMLKVAQQETRSSVQTSSGNNIGAFVDHASNQVQAKWAEIVARR